jgi:hypothetical protein
MKKIVIIPEFASSHFLKYWIQNMIDVIEPDVIIINTGIFPGGVENKKEIDSQFRKKWCYEDTNAGFDYEMTLDIVSEYTRNQFDGDGKLPHIECKIIDYKNYDANICFLNAITHGLESFVSEGTIIFPLEPDAFLYELDKDVISEEISKLMPGEGLKCVWRDFLETQYYCEAINEVSPKFRRFCYCFDNMQNYRRAMDGFMSQNYPLLKYTDKFWVRHYPWFVNGKWKELRYELIYRSDPQYWKDFETGLEKIRYNSDNFVHKKWADSLEGTEFVLRPLPTSKKVMIRPSRQDEGQFAKFIDVPHPKHIHNHPNFVR